MLAAIASLALAPLLPLPRDRNSLQPVVLLCSAAAMALAWVLLHQVASHWLPAREAGGGGLPWLLAGVVFYAGLFLDDRLTRIAFAAWPLRSPRSPA